ncbi:hypothetical protein [Algisphaera agarilytica]|uniref:Uncharacterized protein n=1 Tax=Algisphaera agarilytica TaxID=1385975 RepID=A0A7X0LLS5_9BACT|nr:hypothetical protein [Algisphaera agarilytica]MBB6430278.1 hypothetical protein [Algisphaera agarilytica]
MLKFLASIVTCVALLGLVNPASGLVIPSTGDDVLAVEFCDKGDKKKKEVEKPAESQLELCKKDGECKGKKGDVEKPAESQVEFCDKGKKKKEEVEKPAESQIELCKKDGECKGKKGDKAEGGDTATE